MISARTTLRQVLQLQLQLLLLQLLLLLLQQRLSRLERAIFASVHFCVCVRMQGSIHILFFSRHFRDYCRKVEWYCQIPPPRTSPPH